MKILFEISDTVYSNSYTNGMIETRALKSAVFHQRLAGSWQPLQRLSGSAAEPLEPLAAKRLLSGSASIFLDFAVQIFCVFKKTSLLEKRQEKLKIVCG